MTGAWSILISITGAIAGAGCAEATGAVVAIFATAIDNAVKTSAMRRHNRIGTKHPDLCCCAGGCAGGVIGACGCCCGGLIAGGVGGTGGIILGAGGIVGTAGD